MAVVALGEPEPGAPPLPDVLRIGEGEGEAPVQLLEAHFYAQLIGDVLPQAAGSRPKDEILKFVSTLQDGTANAFLHLPGANGRRADIHQLMERSCERHRLDDNEVTELERRFYGLSENAAGGRRDLALQPIVKPHVDQARTAFWGAVIQGLNGNGVHLPPFPHEPSEQRRWILDNKQHFRDVEHLALVNKPNLRMLLPDILLFRNLKTLTINGTPIAHLPQFLTLLPKLERVSVRGAPNCDVHHDVWNQFQWDSLLDYLERRFPVDHARFMDSGEFGLGQNIIYNSDHFFTDGPLSCLPRGLFPLNQTLIVEGNHAAVPLRHKVRDALISDCSPGASMAFSIVLLIALNTIFWWGLQALLGFIFPPLWAYLIFSMITLIVLGLTMIDFPTTGRVAIYAVAWGQQFLMALWSSIVYYVIEPLVCACAWMCGQGWNPLIRNA